MIIANSNPSFLGYIVHGNRKPSDDRYIINLPGGMTIHFSQSMICW